MDRHLTRCQVWKPADPGARSGNRRKTVPDRQNCSIPSKKLLRLVARNCNLTRDLPVCRPGTGCAGLQTWHRMRRFADLAPAIRRSWWPDPGPVVPRAFNGAREGAGIPGFFSPARLALPLLPTRRLRTFLEDVTRDLRHAWRLLQRARGFTVAAVAVLAMCIGANTAVFSVVNSLLLRPLPYPDAHRLVQVVITHDPTRTVYTLDTSIPKFFAWKSERPDLQPSRRISGRRSRRQPGWRGPARAPLRAARLAGLLRRLRRAAAARPDFQTAGGSAARPARRRARSRVLEAPLRRRSVGDRTGPSARRRIARDRRRARRIVPAGSRRGRLSAAAGRSLQPRLRQLGARRRPDVPEPHRRAGGRATDQHVVRLQAEVSALDGPLGGFLGGPAA